MIKQLNRRDFIKNTALGISIMPFMGLGSFLKAGNIDGEYKAIVVVLLEGGADVFNMIAPNNDDYNLYAEARGSIALKKDTLLDIGNGIGMRNTMHEIHNLYSKNKLAIVSNVGTLIEPVQKDQIINHNAKVPFELFAHNTQRKQWMFGGSSSDLRNGWGARTADILYPQGNPFCNINTSDVNNNLQYGSIGGSTHFDEAFVSPDTIEHYGFGPMSGGGELGKIYKKLYEQQKNSSNRLMSAFAKKRVDKMNSPDKLLDLYNFENSNISPFDNGVHEIGRPLGKQLETVAKLIEAKTSDSKLNRQIFFVNHHGWDTHDSDNEHLTSYLSKSLGEFQNTIDSLGKGKNVTTITISDFGRSLTSNNAGTDHGWGSHTFVMGGAVKGGKIYGKLPVLNRESDDFWDDRMIPTTSVESYLSTVVKWFGVGDNELNEIFPSLKKFSIRNMDFMDKS